MKKIFLFGLWMLIIFFAAEFFLRIVNPFSTVVESARLILPANKTYRLRTVRTSAPEPILINHRNSLGFRGEDPPVDFDRYVTIVTMGGGITAEDGISDGRTWTDLLGLRLKQKFGRVWINNAGYAGHTTFGHELFLTDFVLPLKPTIIIFVLGVNDIETAGLTRMEKNMMKGRLSFVSPKEFVLSLGRNVRFVRLGLNFLRRFVFTESVFGNPEVFFDRLPMSAMTAEEEKKLMELSRSQFVKGYRSRVERLAMMCRENGVFPIFVTQPVAYGVGKDERTGGDLEQVDIGGGKNGRAAWNVLELYNDELRRMSKEKGYFVVDMARGIPKGSRYFFAFTLLNEEGDQRMAEILDWALTPKIADMRKSA